MTNDQVNLPDFEVNEVLTSLSQSIDWGLKYSNIPNTWKISEGEEITVAVIDTGMPKHVDIGDNAVEGDNFIPYEDIYDYNGHQTHCVGIINAKNNNEGFVGVAPKAKCVCIKALGKSGGGTIKGVIQALEYAIKIKPDIVSMSLGSRSGTKELHDKIKTLYDMNIPVVCSAGNSGQAGVSYPAAYPETIAIAAFDKNGKIANFSSRGSEVDWSAPGVDIMSTYLNNKYASFSGTSMACPFMVGVIALMLSKHKKQERSNGKNDCRTVADIREHLLKYTNDKGTVGKDNDWGYGVIDVEKLLATTTTTTAPTTTTTLKPREVQKRKFNYKPILIGIGVIALVGIGFLIFKNLTKEPPVIDWDEKYLNDPNKIK